jgi:hypothetical protein
MAEILADTIHRWGVGKIALTVASNTVRELV